MNLLSVKPLFGVLLLMFLLISLSRILIKTEVLYLSFVNYFFLYYFISLLYRVCILWALLSFHYFNEKFCNPYIRLFILRKSLLSGKREHFFLLTRWVHSFSYFHYFYLSLIQQINKTTWSSNSLYPFPTWYL